MVPYSKLPAWAGVLVIAATLPGADAMPAHPQGQAPNIVLVVLDDVGPERLSFYGEGPSPAKTPTLTALAARSLVFRNVWSNPFCAPTRATINTGLYAIHSGLGSNPAKNGSRGLPLSADILPELLPLQYSSVAVGKWHLSDYGMPPTHPNDSGYMLYAGSLRNLGPGVKGEDYFTWRHTVNGSTFRELTYAPTANINGSIRAFSTLPQPIFLHLAFNSIHTPLHKPPANLHTQQNLPPDPGDDPIAYVNAMTEAADTELGRLLAVLPANTYVIVVGDNGPYAGAVEPPLDPNRVKGTVYQGGIRVPLLISGPRVVPGSVDSLVGTVDLFATILELAGLKQLPATDSVSLLPYFTDTTLSLRRYAYSERFRPNGLDMQSVFERDRAVRDTQYKLVRRLRRPDEFYDLIADPYERVDLLAKGMTPSERRAFGRLSAYMESM